MIFDPTPTNMAEVLLLALAAWAGLVLWKRRLDSNLPLIFYLFLLAFRNATERTINIYLLCAGLGLVLLLRFEFLNSGFTKIVLMLEFLALGLITWTCVGHILGPGSALYW
jgi:hypothetical protein